MNYFIFFIFIFLGFFAGSFFLIQSLIVLRFGIPFTQKLLDEHRLKANNSILRGYLISLVIWLTLFIAITLLILKFFPSGFSGFVIGCIVVILVGFNKTGANAANIEDYLEANKRFLIDGSNTLLDRARDAVLRNGFASVSMFQKRFQIGYASACRLMDQLEEEGLIEEGEDARPRAIKKKE